MAWIEIVATKSAVPLSTTIGQGTKLVLRVLSFPEPGMDHQPMTSRLVRDLNVPEKILKLALHLFIEPALGCIIIIASDNVIYRVPFA